MFFTDDILETVVEQSNLYAIQCDPNKPLNLSLVFFRYCGVYSIVWFASHSLFFFYVGASGNVVLRLAQIIPKKQSHKLFFDNWFTGVPLILTLAKDGIHATGTVRSNRLPGVNLTSDADLKRTERGSFTEKIALVGDTSLHAVKWHDNRAVTLLSNYMGAHPVTEVKRWDGKRKEVIKVPCPAVVRDHNKNMGGVDLLDSLIALYRTKIRSKKYHRLVPLC